jgi:hypothetical protein
MGYRILRLTADLVESDLQRALEVISRECPEGPSPSLEGEGWPKAGVRE